MPTRSSRRMARAVAAAVVASALALTSCSRTETTQAESPAPASTPSVSSISPTEPTATISPADPEATATLRSPTITAPATAPPGVIPPGACVTPSPGASETVHTIAVTDPAPERFAAIVESDPPAACPGDPVDFAVTVENLTTTRQTFDPFYGLLLQSGPTKYILGRLQVVVDAGDRQTIVISATVPNIPAGVYGLWAGTTPGGSIRVLDPPPGG